MPEVQTITDGWQTFARPNENGSNVPAFKLLVADSKVYAFEEHFYDMPEFGSYKYSIAVEGGQGAVLNYTEDEPVWVRFGFAGFNKTPNTTETFFVHAETIYSLISSRTGETHFQSLFRFDVKTEEFEDEKLETPEAIPGSEGSESLVIVAENTSEETDRILIVSTSGKFQIFSIDMSDSSSRTISHLGDVDNDGPHIGHALAAVRHGETIYITYGVHGCGFIWERSHIYTYNLETKTTGSISVAGEVGDEPVYTYGPNSTWVSGSDWGFCSGAARKGMCDSEFNGGTYVIVGLLTEDAKWEKKEGEFGLEDEGLVATDSTKKATIVVSKEKTNVLYHE